MRPGMLEILLIGLAVLLLFGAGRLADIGKGLGEGIKNFRKGLKDETADNKELPEGAEESDAKG